MKAIYSLSMPLLALVLSSAASAEQAGPLALTIDTAEVVGPLKPFDGVNGQPISDRWGGTDATRGYRDARIGFIRLHDAGAGDIDSVHTNRMQVVPGGAPRVMRPRVELNPLSMFLNPDADADDPASYNFGPTDTLIAQIHAAGAEPFFRIGRSWGADSDPPKDFDKFARIAAHVVKHYNFGWANGFHYGIRYWEVWNEPDMSLFWQGQPEQYFELYAKVAKAVKAADPAALVGGPVQSLPNDDHPYGNDFLAYVRDHKLPLDFYSWHWYAFANDPYDFVRLGRKLRDRLDHYGFQRTISIIDELSTPPLSARRWPTCRKGRSTSR
jgi:hypothetical protein